MATLTVTIPDANVNRVRQAFGHPTSNSDPTWMPATTAEVQDAVTAMLRRRVHEYEERIAAEAAVAAVTNAL